MYGVDESSGAEDLVTALLEDPLASDPNENIRDRWKDRTQRTLLIRLADGPPFNLILNLTSRLLARNRLASQ